MKKKIAFFLATLLMFGGVFLAKPSLSLAFPAVLGTKIIGDQQVSIDGYLIDDPEDPIIIDTQQPNFSGYTVANAEILLIIASDPIEAETLSDANGYWSYTMENPLEAGQHTLSLKVTDSSGIASEEALVATFIVPEVRGEQTAAPVSEETPLPKSPAANYLTITIGVLGALTLLGVIYAFFLRKPR